MSHRSRMLVASVSAIALLFVVLQTAVLPPEGFFSGDQGAKFLQTRAFAEHGPLNPGIEVRSRDVDPDYRHQILENRGGRLVGVFSWLMPMLGAPFMRLLGSRGLYVVPMLSAIVIFLAAAALGRNLGIGDGWWSAWTTLLAAPVVFYGAELWEHAPAAACVMVAAVLLAPPRRSAILAGAVLAIGALFREEALLALPAFLVARAVSIERDRFTDLVRTGAGALLGAAAIFAASVPVNLLVYRSVLPLHLVTEVNKATSYLDTRVAVSGQLLLPSLLVPAFAVALAGAVILVIVQVRGRAARAPWRRADDARLAMILIAAAVLLFVAVLLPMWRMVAWRIPQFQAYSLDSVVHTWPFWIALLFVPLLTRDDVRPEGVRFVGAGAVLLALGALAIVPSHGGAQWSPRYLFVAAPLFAVLAAAPARRVSGLPVSRATVVLWSARITLSASVLAQVSGLVYLSEAKARNARITERLASLMTPDEVVITDIAWFPQVTATLLPARRILLAWSPADVHELARQAARHGFRDIALVVSTPETHFTAPPVLDASEAGCLFTRTVRFAFGERGLIFHRYACGPPPGVIK